MVNKFLPIASWCQDLEMMISRQASLIEILCNSHALDLRLIVPHGYFYFQVYVALGTMRLNSAKQDDQNELLQ